MRIAKDDGRADRHRLEGATGLREHEVVVPQETFGVRAAVADARPNDVQRQIRGRAGFLHGVEVRSWRGVVTENERTPRSRRERPARQKPREIDGVVNHAGQVVGNRVVSGQTLEAVLVDRDVATDTAHQRGRRHVGRAMVADKDAARARKSKQRLDGLHVLIGLNDVRLLRHKAEVRPDRDAGRPNLVAKVSGPGREHHRPVPCGTQAECKIAQDCVGSAAPIERVVCQQNPPGGHCSP